MSGFVAPRIRLPVLTASAFVLIACAPSASFPTVTVKELKTAVDAGAFVLDVRTPAEYAEGHIAGSTLIPLDSVQARAQEVPSDKPIYVICRSGNRSAQASSILKKAGKDVRNVSGGLNDWVAAGYPTTR